MFHKRYEKCVEDRQTRRAVLSGIASTLGVSIVSPWSRILEAAPNSAASKAKKVIYFYMSGAMSHIDTFDPKPDRPDIQGDVGVVTRRKQSRITSNKLHIQRIDPQSAGGAKLLES